MKQRSFFFWLLSLEAQTLLPHHLALHGAYWKVRGDAGKHVLITALTGQHILGQVTRLP